MAEFIAGPTLVMSWTTATGTTALAGDYRTCTWSPTVDYVETSAGSDTHKSRLKALLDATAAITLVDQSAGTLRYVQLAAGLAGTLIVQPEGTAAGKRKITLPAYCDGASYEFPYNDIVTVSCGFTELAAFTDATN